MQNEAITYARNGNWEAAIDSSRQLLSSDPNDIETLNRLAKAYFENGEIDNAEQTYQRVLEISEHNPIARRMVSLIARTRSAPAKTREFVDMRMFAIETGKSTLTSLHIDTDAEISLVPGEKLTFAR
jgi:tetratricopeptide (TPR) repeat protein